MTILSRNGTAYCLPAAPLSFQHLPALPLGQLIALTLAPHTQPLAAPYFARLERTSLAHKHALIGEGIDATEIERTRRPANIAPDRRGYRIPGSLLTVVEERSNGDFFLVRCDCGKRRVLRRARVLTTSKLAFSCGCTPRPSATTARSKGNKGSKGAHTGNKEGK